GEIDGGRARVADGDIAKVAVGGDGPGGAIQTDLAAAAVQVVAAGRHALQHHRAKVVVHADLALHVQVGQADTAAARLDREGAGGTTLVHHIAKTGVEADRAGGGDA